MPQACQLIPGWGLDSAFSLIERGVRISRDARLTIFRDGHFLNECGEFLSLPSKYFELPLCILVGEREEFHR